MMAEVNGHYTQANAERDALLERRTELQGQQRSERRAAQSQERARNLQEQAMASADNVGGLADIAEQEQLAALRQRLAEVRPSSKGTIWFLARLAMLCLT
jgi:hypothetical protein